MSVVARVHLPVLRILSHEFGAYLAYSLRLCLEKRRKKEKK